MTDWEEVMGRKKKKIRRTDLDPELRRSLLQPEPIRRIQQPNPTIQDLKYYNEFNAVEGLKGCRKYGFVSREWCNSKCPLNRPDKFESQLGEDGSPNGVCKHEKYGKVHHPAYFEGVTNLCNIGLKVKRVA